MMSCFKFRDIHRLGEESSAPWPPYLRRPNRLAHFSTELLSEERLDIRLAIDNQQP
jgi:hypothetical protein